MTAIIPQTKSPSIFKNIFNPGIHSTIMNIWLLVLRLAVGGAMLTHGTGKLMNLIGDEPIKFADPLGIGVTPSLALAVFAEFVCSILLILGLVTRLATIPLMITMLVAICIVHANDPFGKKELPMLYVLIYLTLAFAGAGKYSVDNLIYRR